MRISVENFKGIRKLTDFPIHAITVLAGANSGGKSSLIQLLLLLKQSLETRSTTSPLKLNRPYVSLGRFENLLRRAGGVNSFSVTIHFGREELEERLIDLITGKRKSPGMRTADFMTSVNEIAVQVAFKKVTAGVAVDLFRVDIIGPERTIFLQIRRYVHGKSHEIETNSASYFLRQYRYHDGTGLIKSGNLPEAATFKDRVGFLGFFPNELDFEKEDLYISFSPLMSQIGAALHRAFSKISYIGPLREEPREFYYHDDDFVDHIGNKGENGAFLLSKHASDRTTYKQYERMEAGYDVTTRTGTLEEAVNYWMCSIFALAKSIKVSKAKTNRHLYEVHLRRNDGSSIPITHVGFGISQIFPILVEGL